MDKDSFVGDFTSGLEVKKQQEARQPKSTGKIETKTTPQAALAVPASTTTVVDHAPWTTRSTTPCPVLWSNLGRSQPFPLLSLPTPRSLYPTKRSRSTVHL